MTCKIIHMFFYDIFWCPHFFYNLVLKHLIGSFFIILRHDKDLFVHVSSPSRTRRSPRIGALRTPGLSRQQKGVISVVLEVAEGDAASVKTGVEQAMAEGFLAVFPDGVAALVEAKAGPNWAAAK